MARTKSKAPTAAQLHRVLAANREGYMAYERARLALKAEGRSKAEQKRLAATMEANRPAYSAYWKAYCQPVLVAERAEQRAAKAATG